VTIHVNHKEAKQDVQARPVLGQSTQPGLACITSRDSPGWGRRPRSQQANGNSWRSFAGPVQSIDVGEVAGHLISQGDKGPAAYLPDIGGPQVLTIEEMTEAYLRIKGRRSTIRSSTFTGEPFNVFTSGINVVPANATGTITREAFLHYRFSQKHTQHLLL